MGLVCLILASKATEESKSFESACKVYINLQHEKKRKNQPPPIITSTIIENMRKGFVVNEYQLLKEIDFQFSVDMPYSQI